MSTETLTDWLLAAITEDEERARFVARQIEGNNWQPFEPWKLSWHDEYDLLCIEPSRALAECEAKRRIVEDFILADSDYRLTRLESGEVRRLAALLAVTRVAAIYADRPGHLEEWRP